jgi:hypothetical protein
MTGKPRARTLERPMVAGLLWDGLLALRYVPLRDAVNPIVLESTQYPLVDAHLNLTPGSCQPPAFMNIPQLLH